MKFKHSAFCASVGCVVGILALYPASKSGAQASVDNLQATGPERPDLPFPPTVDVASRCGPTDDLVDIEAYKGGDDFETALQFEASTVQLQWKPLTELEEIDGYIRGNVENRRWCTGTLIADDLVLTAGHCFDTLKERYGWQTPQRLDFTTGSIDYYKPKELAQFMKVNFRYQINGETGAPRSEVSVSVSDLLEYRLGDLDYGIVRLASPATTLAGLDNVEPSSVSDGVPTIELPIAIFQHPNGDYKKIDVGQVQNYGSLSITYGNLDTYGGSSGSAIRASNGEILGVHTHGGCTRTGGANRGVPVEAIRRVSQEIQRADR